MRISELLVTAFLFFASGALYATCRDTPAGVEIDPFIVTGYMLSVGLFAGYQLARISRYIARQ